MLLQPHPNLNSSVCSSNWRFRSSFSIHFKKTNIILRGFCLPKSLRKKTLNHYYADDDYVPIGDSVSFEEGIFEENPFQVGLVAQQEEQEEEKEEQGLIPDKWKELQQELNESKHERKRRILKQDLDDALRKKHELQMLRDGLSKSNVIKLAPVKLPVSLPDVKLPDSNSLTDMEDTDQAAEYEVAGVLQDNESEDGEDSQSTGNTYNRLPIYTQMAVRKNPEVELLDVDLDEISKQIREAFEDPKQEEESEVNKKAREEESFKSIDVSQKDITIVSGDISKQRAVPKNPRLELGNANIEDITKKFQQDYEDSMTKDQVPERRKLYTREEVLLLNSRTPNLQRATSGKWIPLHAFTTAGESFLLDFFLTHNIDINMVDQDGQTALHKAVSCKKKGIINYLLLAGANPHVCDKDGATLMHYAVEVGASHIIRMLIPYKADINQADNYGWTPLHLAVQSKRTDIVRLLLDKGAYTNVRNKDGLSPLDFCLYAGRDPRTYELIRLLKTSKRTGLPTEST